MTVAKRAAVPGSTGADGGASARRWPMVAALAVTQTVGYGVLYYSFAVLLVPIAHDLHASTTAVTGALTASTLAGAVAAVPVGRWLDRHGGRALMTVGSIAATALLVGWSRVDSLPALYAVLIGIGLTSAMVLYEPAFAVIVAQFPDARRRGNALLAVTVVAGFASSIFMPVTGYLTAHHGWRTALLVLAGIHAAVTIPGHALLVRRTRTPVAAAGPTRRTPVRAAVTDRRFWLLTLTFVAHTAAISALTMHLVAYLVERGHPATFAATVAGLLGVLSVAGRLVLTAAARRVSLTTVVAGIFGLQAVAAAALPAAAGTAVGAVATVVAFGLGFGVATIARPTLVTELYGTTAYATISGLLVVPMTVAKATAPLAAAATRSVSGGYTPVMIAVGAAAAVAAVALTCRLGSAYGRVAG